MTKAQEDSFEVVHTHTAYAGWTRLLVATIRLPGGRTINREIEDHGEAICVLPYNPARKTAVLVRQMRASVLFATRRQDTLEAIAGIIEEKTADECARREVKEEALLELDALEPVFTGWTMPGISTEYMHFYFAVYSSEARPEIRGGHARGRNRPCRTGAHGGPQRTARRQDAGVVADLASAQAGIVLSRQIRPPAAGWIAEALDVKAYFGWPMGPVICRNNRHAYMS
jgi:hypothetical protein